MIAQIVSETFSRIGHQWHLDSGDISPTEDDVDKMLDAAARVLYDDDIGTRFEAAGLIIEKAQKGHDVYVYVGSYD